MDNKKLIGHEIRKTDNLLKRNYTKSDFSKSIYHLTGTNGWIIGFLAENSDKEIFQRDIEELFLIRRSTVSNIIQLMEKKGLIARESVPYDARLKKLVLTPKALEIHKVMYENMLKNEERLKTGISDEELEIFFNVIEKIQKNIG